MFLFHAFDDLLKVGLAGKVMHLVRAVKEIVQDIAACKLSFARIHVPAREDHALTASAIVKGNVTKGYFVSALAPLSAIVKPVPHLDDSQKILLALCAFLKAGHGFRLDLSLEPLHCRPIQRGRFALVRQNI